MMEMELVSYLFIYSLLAFTRRYTTSGSKVSNNNGIIVQATGTGTNNTSLHPESYVNQCNQFGHSST